MMILKGITKNTPCSGVCWRNWIDRCIWSFATANPDVSKSNPTTKEYITNSTFRNTEIKNLANFSWSNDLASFFVKFLKCHSAYLPICMAHKGFHWFSYTLSLRRFCQVKGYLHYKTIHCYKVALDMWLMNFFYLKKK